MLGVGSSAVFRPYSHRTYRVSSAPSDPPEVLPGDLPGGAQGVAETPRRGAIQRTTLTRSVRTPDPVAARTR